MDIGSLVTIGTLAVGAVSWGVRVEAKANNVKEKHEELLKRFDRFEDKLDAIQKAVVDHVISCYNARHEK